MNLLAATSAPKTITESRVYVIKPDTFGESWLEILFGFMFAFKQSS